MEFNQLQDKLVNILDNFERALEVHLEDSTEMKIEGFLISKRKFLIFFQRKSLILKK